MRTATALATVPVTPHFGIDSEFHGQVPLPFPDITPVLPAPIEREDIGPLRHRCARFMQALVEVLSGERPARQMSAWIAPDVFDSLNRRLTTVPRRPRDRSTRLMSVHVSMVGDEVAEVAARMVHHGRSHAVAARLEPQVTHRGQRVWRCTAVEWA